MKQLFSAVHVNEDFQLNRQFGTELIKQKSGKFFHKLIFKRNNGFLLILFQNTILHDLKHYAMDYCGLFLRGKTLKYYAA